MKPFQKALLTNIVLSANRASDAVLVIDLYGYCIQAVITGTPTGTLKLQASCDPFKYAQSTQPQVPTNWTDIADTSVAVSAAGSTMWNINGAFYTFVRLVYTDGSSGSSTAVITANMTAKGV